jgi:hypothetical protein
MRGDRIRVFVRANRDAFVTVFRVDTDGRVRVLFPREPWEDTFVRRDREYEIEGSGGRDAFAVDTTPALDTCSRSFPPIVRLQRGRGR